MEAWQATYILSSGIVNTRFQRFTTQEDTSGRSREPLSRAEVLIG